MIYLKGSIAGYEIAVHGIDDETFFTADCLEGGRKRFSTASKLEEAVRTYDLRLRKDFSNKKAISVAHGGVVETVTVAAIVDDGSAWITRQNGRREKVSRSALYATFNEVAAAKELEARARLEIAEAWAGVAKWEPHK